LWRVDFFLSKRKSKKKPEVQWRIGKDELS